MELRDESDLLFRIIWPYVEELINSILDGKAKVEEATGESLAELLCYQVEPTVRRMVRELNEKMRNGEIESLKVAIGENPKIAQKASKYVAKRLKSRIRKLIAEELRRNRP
jgi:hypothetical protein